MVSGTARACIWASRGEKRSRTRTGAGVEVAVGVGFAAHSAGVLAEEGLAAETATSVFRHDKTPLCCPMKLAGPMAPPGEGSVRCIISAPAWGPVLVCDVDRMTSDTLPHHRER
ncbi:hypothetical protein NDU88_003433 [Pleurodeles waltl]|uniref:Uncharacterized protein n=1 Tax=Pleurodeles waltl TaxID=8319 RepID=A0AAV7SEN7_PLEWA|nr:hypothetical protein NDU88_003433 [Pleurodeles waltl]